MSLYKITYKDGSTNQINVVRATFKALQGMKSPRQIAEKRGLSVDAIEA